MSSAESETGGLYSNEQNGAPMCTNLEFLDHPKPKDGTPLVTDNTSSHGLLTKLMKQKRAKDWDMRYHWLEDRVQQKQFKIIWRKGIENRRLFYEAPPSSSAPEDEIHVLTTNQCND